MPPTRFRRLPWSNWSDERLLQLRLRDLGVTIEGTWLEDCVTELYAELDQRRLRLRPHVWLSDEWFSPGNVPGFAVPFYLTHPRLMRLERRELLEVEGGTHAECMQIMRHECGHAVQHGYQLHRRREWQKLFGKSSTKYPESYRPNPASKKYVQHLRRWYAQSHPDEDFAETFAVWLQAAFGLAPALRGLARAQEAAVRRPAHDGARRRRRRVVRNKRRVDPLRTRLAHARSSITPTGARSIRSSIPTRYDEDLLRLFSLSQERPHARVRGEFPPPPPHRHPPRRLEMDRASTSSRSTPCWAT